MINSRLITDLTPDTQLKCKAFMAGCLLEGIDVIITSTYRDNESQAALYAQGRTKPGAIVTKAKQGHSYHNFRLAFDFVPIVNGKALWNDHKLWDKCGEVADLAGLEWGGTWRFKDKPHCQNTQGFSLAELRIGKAVLA
jgi:peptidoglycan L-alanyl-D-glutamate endopeptidase CwlK